MFYVSGICCTISRSAYDGQNPRIEDEAVRRR